MTRDSFILYTKFYKPVEALSNDQLGRLFRALFQYASSDDPVCVDSDIKLAFNFFSNQMDIDNAKWLEKCQKLKENSNKRKSNQKLSIDIKSNQIGSDNDNDSVSVSVYDSVNDILLSKEENIKKKDANATRVFKKPTIQEIAEYCQERKNNIDPEEFFAFYDSNGWKVGRNPMKNWKQAVITWEKRKDNGSNLNKRGSAAFNQRTMVCHDWSNEHSIV